jgi:hypothetical protein
MVIITRLLTSRDCLHAAFRVLQGTNIKDISELTRERVERTFKVGVDHTQKK